VGQVRLAAEVRDPDNVYYGATLLDEATGVRVYLYGDGVLLDSCSTDLGSYGFLISDQGVYSLRTWVVPALVETAGPVTCTATSCETPDTLMLGKYGEISFYPNPFMVAARVAFDLTESIEVLLTVRGIGGQTVRTIGHGAMPPGRHTIQWDGTDDEGARVPAGPYWIVLSAGDEYRYILALVEELE
jgi:hypothetical protein